MALQDPAWALAGPPTRSGGGSEHVQSSGSEPSCAPPGGLSQADCSGLCLRVTCSQCLQKAVPTKHAPASGGCHRIDQRTDWRPELDVPGWPAAYGEAGRSERPPPHRPAAERRSELDDPKWPTASCSCADRPGESRPSPDRTTCMTREEEWLDANGPPPRRPAVWTGDHASCRSFVGHCVDPLLDRPPRRSLGHRSNEGLKEV
jgi:hypothetical protein